MAQRKGDSNKRLPTVPFDDVCSRLNLHSRFRELLRNVSKLSALRPAVTFSVGSNVFRQTCMHNLCTGEGRGGDLIVRSDNKFHLF